MSRRNLPETGALVMGTVKSIFDHGVYVDLDEYEDLQAYCHVSEVSSTWVRNIRNVMRLGKKVVGRVMRVKENQIDISIKRVSDELKRTKVEEWKHYKTAITFLEMAAKQRKIDLETARTEVEDKSDEFYGSLFHAFEESLFKGESVFTDAGITEEWAKVLTDIARKNLTIPKVAITRDVEIICWEGDGIKTIKKALEDALKAREEIDVGEKELNLELYARGAPVYRFMISARDYQLAEQLMALAFENIEKSLVNHNASVRML